MQCSENLNVVKTNLILRDKKIPLSHRKKSNDSCQMGDEKGPFRDTDFRR